MDRRNISRNIFAAALGAAVIDRAAVAQTCATPCFARTQAEINAGVVPVDTSVPPYRSDRYGFSNATSATGSANYTALKNAVLAATAACSADRDDYNPTISIRANRGASPNL